MSLRPKRALAGFVAATAALVALPASALAVGESLSVTPTGTQAGSSPSITATLRFAAGDTPKTVVTSLAPGLLANLNANPSCLANPPQLMSACQIGTATAHTTAGDSPGNLYLVPGQTGDAAGIEYVPSSGPLTAQQYIGVSLNPNASGSLNLTTSFAPPAGVQISGFDATFNGTLNGQPFTRLPTSCSTATSTMSVTYQSGATGSASGPFMPMGCNTLAYSPNLTAAITRDKSGSGATLLTGITQAANEAASQKIVLVLPKGLTPNVTAVSPCLSGTGSGCKIGTAVATSPLVPSAALANGTITLSGSITAPTLSISFPAPFAITITGSVSVSTNSVTFANVPDVPLTSLTLNVTGPNGQKAFNTDCAPASVRGQFTAQSGAAHNATAAVKFTGCALTPTASGSTSGLAGGHPKLKFKVTHGKGAANVAAVAIGLPRGLNFSRSAIVTHRTCRTKDKKKQCTTTTLIKGLGIAGGKAKSVAIRGGKLVITLRKPAGSVSITVSEPLVSESKSLQNSVKKHRVKSLKFSLKITDAKKVATTLSLKLRAH